ncbi:MAG TPA: nuclear transport factor 2 family protein [Steroidobacteraceae bacterium]|jgi:ketosteroid isomerase-like protein|nr:nuclear transport factor 2 family protein [Steroidobacteraceae bacterium]
MDETNAWVAKAAISELITRYAALNDAGDWDGVAALYTDDGRMSRPSAPDDFIAGRAAILAAFRARPLRAARHIIANVLVTLNSDTEARATSQILLFTGVSAGDGLPVQSAMPLVGTYRDRLMRTPHGWRFLERRGSLDFRAP